MKIGVMFGNPETTSGGSALKFYSSVRLDIRRIGAIKDGEPVDRQPDQGQGREEQGGAAVPRREFDIIYGKGISLEGDLLDLGLEHGVITQKGTWFALRRTCSSDRDARRRERIWKRTARSSTGWSSRSARPRGW